jgi:VWFA-related protein
MKHCFLMVLFLAFVSLSFGQAPSTSSTPAQSPSPENPRTKDFGSSLKKYEKKKQKKDSQPQQNSNVSPEDNETIRVQTDLVASDVLVTDQKSNVITDLKKDDFIVSEDEVPQTIEMFSPGESATIPRSIVLIIDSQIVQGPYLKKSVEAAKILVDKLNPNDKMAIVTNALKLRLDFTQDKTLLKNTLDSLNAIENTSNEFDSLLVVLNEMFKEEDQQRIIIFQADGNEIMWLKPDKDVPYPVSYSTLETSGLKYVEKKYLPKFGFGDVKEAIERSRATIYSVIPGIRFLGLPQKEQLKRAEITLTQLNEFYGWNKKQDMNFIIRKFQYAEAEIKTAGQTAMFKVAELSGGNAGFIEKPEDAENIYSDIFTVIKNRYVIGYYPTNQNRDGKRRNVKIEVRNHPEYTVTGRKAYFAPENGK